MIQRASVPLTRVVGILLALFLVALIGRRVVLDWQRMPPEGLAAFRLSAAPLVAAGTAQTLGWFLAVDIWRRMLDAIEGRLAWWEHARLYACSALAQVVPGSIWVPASRVAAYRQMGVNTWAVSAAMGLEWLLVGSAGLLVFVGSSPFAPLPVRWQWLLPATLVLVGAILWGSPRPWREVRRRLAERLHVHGLETLRRKVLVGWLAAEAVVVLLGGISLHLFMLGVTDRGEVALAIAVSALTGALFAWLTWLPLTSVLRSGMIVMLLAPVYDSSLIALAVAVAWRMWCLLLGVAWAVLASALATLRSFRDG